MKRKIAEAAVVARALGVLVPAPKRSLHHPEDGAPAAKELLPPSQWTDDRKCTVNVPVVGDTKVPES